MNKIAARITDTDTIDLGHGPERVVKISRTATESQIDITTDRTTYSVWSDDLIPVEG